MDVGRREAGEECTEQRARAYELAASGRSPLCERPKMSHTVRRQGDQARCAGKVRRNSGGLAGAEHGEGIIDKRITPPIHGPPMLHTNAPRMPSHKPCRGSTNLQVHPPSTVKPKERLTACAF